MRILALDAALARCSAGLAIDDALVAVRLADGDRGAAAILPCMAAEVLAEAGLDAASLDLVAVTVGPGGFTGLRAALSLAHGLALAAGRRLAGVTTGEALAAALPDLGGRALWVAIDDRRGGVFLEREGTAARVAAAAIPMPAGPLAIAGDAAVAVAARLAARGHDVMLTDSRLPQPLHVARAAAARLAAALPLRPARPLYVAPPATRAPRHPVRPPPA